MPAAGESPNNRRTERRIFISIRYDKLRVVPCHPCNMWPNQPTNIDSKKLRASTDSYCLMARAVFPVDETPSVFYGWRPALLFQHLVWKSFTPQNADALRIRAVWYIRSPDIKLLARRRVLINASSNRPLKIRMNIQIFYSNKSGQWKQLPFVSFSVDSAFKFYIGGILEYRSRLTMRLRFLYYAFRVNLFLESTRYLSTYPPWVRID